MMSIRNGLSIIASAVAVEMISSSAMAQMTQIDLPTLRPEPGTFGIMALGIGIAIYLSRGARKK